MKRITVIGFWFIWTSCYAGTTCNQLGTTTFCDNDAGDVTTINELGNSTYIETYKMPSPEMYKAPSFETDKAPKVIDTDDEDEE